ncbi:MAG: hypothetical protein ACE5FO_12215 [Parvularculaceae bacterium]
MTNAVGQLLVILFGLWLIVVGVLMAAKPQTALRCLGKAASTNVINYAELTLRLIAGLALALYAEFSRFPEIFRIVGWFVVATSGILYFVPRPWHARYAVWWAENLTASIVRLLAPVSIAGGVFLIYAAV